MAPVFMSENEFKKEQGECSLGVDREGAHSAPSTGRRQQGLHRGQDTAVRLWTEVGPSLAENPRPAFQRGETS